METEKQLGLYCLEQREFAEAIRAVLQKGRTYAGYKTREGPWQPVKWTEKNPVFITLICDSIKLGTRNVTEDFFFSFSLDLIE